MKVIEAKIVVLGSQGVGKTSLVVRYIGKMFSRHISPTIGASFFTCNINLAEARVKLQVWDTAGQERFRSMAPMYYRNANAALLVFDITCRASFAAVKSWVKELQSNAPGPLVLALVGNKADLAGAPCVPATDAARYAAALGAPYTETSALHDQVLHTPLRRPRRALHRDLGAARPGTPHPPPPPSPSPSSQYTASASARRASTTSS
ncbi:Ras-related protein Rab-31 [Papilio machaon]|uniref:Ras-related protein Rab-31 n=1 Tax=Papilio machaon TaxID=76193 RepID=A0A0N0PBH4_PAPMA|nr:Ras-related protein Rab-31 [Papilio machaon]